MNVYQPIVGYSRIFHGVEGPRLNAIQPGYQVRHQSWDILRFRGYKIAYVDLVGSVTTCVYWINVTWEEGGLSVVLCDSGGEEGCYKIQIGESSEVLILWMGHGVHPHQSATSSPNNLVWISSMV